MFFTSSRTSVEMVMSRRRSLTTTLTTLLLISAILSDGQRRIADGASTDRVVDGGLQSAGSSNDCRGSAERFRSQNLTTHHHAPLEKMHEPDLEVCVPQSPDGRGLSCCTRHLERQMHEMAITDARVALASTSVWMRMVTLASEGTSYRDDTRQLLLTSSNATITSLADTYQLDCRDSCVSRFFAELNEYFDQPSTSSLDNIRSQVTRLLDSLFASAFMKHFGHHSSTSRRTSANSQQYFNCVADLRQTVFPLENLEHQLTDDLVKAVRTTRAVLDAFEYAAEVIRWSIGIGDQQTAEATENTRSPEVVFDLLTDHQCSRALTRLRRCALCDGHADLERLRPCRQFCTNVARGCLAPLMGSLPADDVSTSTGGQHQQPSFSLSWDLYTTVVNQVIVAIHGPYDIDRVLTGFLSRLTTEVLEDFNQINSTQISSRCNLHHHGVDSTATSSSDKVAPPVNVVSHRTDRSPRLVDKFRRLGQSLAAMQNFYSRLPDALCRSDRMSATALDNCWNGANFGIYNKIVPPINFREQLHNPEVKVANTIPEAIVNVTRKLSDMTKLMHSFQPPRPTPVSRPVRYQRDWNDHQDDDDVDDMSGEYTPDYYPGDDEDGYLSGSGSGDPNGPEEPVTPSTRAAAPTSSSIDIVFEPSTSKLPPPPTPPTIRHHHPSTTRSPTVPPVGISHKPPTSGAAGNGLRSSAAIVTAAVVAVIIARSTGGDPMRSDSRQL